MNDPIYIEPNSDEIIDIDVPTFDTGAVESGTLVPVSNVNTNEMNVVANKAFVSFGTMLLCIVIFLVFAYFFKKKNFSELFYHFQTKLQEYIPSKGTSEEIESTEQKQSVKTSQYSPRPKKRSTLNTPTSISKCIRAFLENTKEN